MGMITDWLINQASGKVAAALLKLALAFLAAHNPQLAAVGVSLNVDPNQATAAIFGVLSYLWHKLTPRLAALADAQKAPAAPGSSGDPAA